MQSRPSSAPLKADPAAAFKSDLVIVIMLNSRKGKTAIFKLFLLQTVGCSIQSHLQYLNQPPGLLAQGPGTFLTLPRFLARSLSRSLSILPIPANLA